MSQNPDDQFDCTEIYPGLWLGSIKATQNTSFLKQNKIVTIINCTVNMPFPKLKQIKYTRRLSVKDNLKASEIYKLYSQLDTIVNFIANHMKYGPILVHCHAGRQRSVSVIIRFLIKFGQMSVDDALTMIQTKRPIAGIPSLNFKKALVSYQMEVSEHLNKI